MSEVAGYVVSLDPEQRAVVTQLWGEAFVAQMEATLTALANQLAQTKEEQ